MRKRDIHVSISHSEGCRESRRRGNETQLIMEKGALWDGVVPAEIIWAMIALEATKRYFSC